MPHSSQKSDAFLSLQNTLNLGLSCLKDLWRYEARDWLSSVHAADINQDGDLEILVSSLHGRVYALGRDGQERWQKIVGEKTPITSLITLAPPLGWEDSQEASPIWNARVVVSTSNGRIYVLNEYGKEIPPPGHEETGPNFWLDVKKPITAMWVDPGQPLNIVFAAEDHRVYWFDLALNQVRWSYAVNGPIGAISAADVDGDGQVEVVVGSDNQTLYLISSTGELLNTYMMDQAIFTLNVADIDQDGAAEILVGTRTKRLFVLTPALYEKWSQVLSSRPLAITVADVNKDRRLEIIVSCDDQSLVIFDDCGKQIWRQSLGSKRYRSLHTFDLDRDGHVEVLAGADNASVYAFRVQLIPGLDRKIRRDYSALGKPDITSLVDLNKDQLTLLLSVLGSTFGGFDRELSLTMAHTQMEAGEYMAALLTLMKLEQQTFQWLWKKEQMGYRRALCLLDLVGEQRRALAVSALDGSLTVFNPRGRFLFSVKSPDDGQIFDVQAGSFYLKHGKALAFATTTGALFILDLARTRPTTLLALSEPISCFYLLAPSSDRITLLTGTENGKAYLYTNEFHMPARIFEFPSPVYRTYASDPNQGGKYCNPELLMCTTDNKLYAYTRGGNRLWTFSMRSRILALCIRDLDNDSRLEVLIGTEDRNIYVLDDEGNMRWRYVLFQSVLALETVDLNNDGQQEILAGCADGILYLFTSAGDMIKRYVTSDSIQSLRAGDIDQDGNIEIAMMEENRLEVLQVVNQLQLNHLIERCWIHLLKDREPLSALLPLIKHQEPRLRVAGLSKLATLDPLPNEAFDLLSEAMMDSFTEVRASLPEALMSAYPTDPMRARLMLTTLFTERLHDVRIEVVEHLELLARYDWEVALIFLERALNASERNTRRAAVRKIAHLLKGYVAEIKSNPSTLGEALFRLLLVAAQDERSAWVRHEAGRALADFLNVFEGDCLIYLSRMFANRLRPEALDHTAYNLHSPPVRQVVANLVALSSRFEKTDVMTALTTLARTLNTLSLSSPSYAYSTDLWLIFRELRELFSLNGLEELAAYEFRLKPLHFQTIQMPYPHTQAFLRLGDQFSTVTRPLKTFLSRIDPNDRLSSLLESLHALESVQRLLEREYGVSPLPGVPPPHQIEYTVLNVLFTRWQELFRTQRNELHGHAEIQCLLLSRIVHLEEVVGIQLRISNHGRAPARNVHVALLSDESFTTTNRQPQSCEINALLASEDLEIEFLIRPAMDSVTLTFEITFEDVEHEFTTQIFQDHLNFIERPEVFTRIENPYSPGPLVSNDMCYGREASLAYLQENLTRPAQTMLVLYGQRRSGKTTLLTQLAQTGLLEQHIPVLIDLQRWAYSLDAAKLFFGLSYQIFTSMKKKGIALSEPQRRDFFSMSEDPLFSFEQFLDHVETLLGERKLILLLDEFEVLEEYVKAGALNPGVFLYLRSLMQHRLHLHFLLSGTHHIELLTRDYWSVFFNIALHYRLPSRISPQGAEALITQPVSGSLEYEPQVVRKIRLLTADQPYMIHLLCRELVDHCNRQRKNYATLNDVNLALNSLSNAGIIHFDWLWDRLKKREQLLLQAIAESIKEERRFPGLDEIENIYRQYHYPFAYETIIDDLKTLWAEDVIEIQGSEQQTNIFEGERYTIPNGLFLQWLRRNKHLKIFT